MGAVGAWGFGWGVGDGFWLANSRLSFAASNWAGLLQGLVCCALACAFIATASRRLRTDASRAAIVIRKTLVVAELLWRGAPPIGAPLPPRGPPGHLLSSADPPVGGDP